MQGNTILKALSVACAGALLIACEDAGRTVAPSPSAPTVPSFTAASGLTAIDFGPGGTIARATLDGFKLKRVWTPGHKQGWPHGRWEVGLEARPQLDFAVRSFEYEPGGFTGWHTHPGPVLIQVVRGEVTFYDANDPECKPRVVRAGEAILDTGEHAHIGRNETAEVAQDLVVLFAPPGVGFRAEADDPGHCPFPS
jgi:quercetin dioxygenase-like cupin family protein